MFEVGFVGLFAWLSCLVGLILCLIEFVFLFVLMGKLKSFGTFKMFS